MTRADAYAARLRSFERFSLAAGALTALAGGLVLVGWWLDVAALKSLLPGLATMKPNTGLGFVFLGVALWLAQRPSPMDSRLAVAARAMAGVPALIGLLTLAEYFLGIDLRFDNWLFREALNAERMPFPGRMAHATAFNLAMFGLALPLLSSKSRRLQVTAQGLALTGTLSGLVAMTGYLLGAKQLYGVAAFSTVALPTALLSTLVGFAILAARPSVGVMTAITDNHHGGFIARRILPATLILPLLNAWLRLKGQQAGLYDTEFGLAIFAMSNVMLFALFVWWSAQSLNTSAAAHRTSEGRFRTLFERAPDGIVVTDSQGRFIDANETMGRMVGYHRDEIAALRILDIVAPSETLRIGAAFDAVRAGADYHQEWQARRKDGSTFPVEVVGARMPDGNLMGLIRDITERRKAEEEVRTLYADLERRVAERTEELGTANKEIALSLLAKEQLLQETHHRVKNNLALIVSLMRIIAGRSLESETKSVLKEMQDRIHSVILLNETLYKTASYTRVNLADYLKTLATYLFQAQGAKTGEVRLVLDLEPVDVSARLAIPCGLLVNELMTNSLKHAFPKGQRGEVRLVLRHETDGRVCLQVKDTGPGLPQDFDERRLRSLGMQLVSDLARQVGGPLEIGPGPGASFSVVFRPEPPAD